MAAIKQNVSKLSARSGVGERGPGRGERHRGCPRFGGGGGGAFPHFGGKQELPGWGTRRGNVGPRSGGQSGVLGRRHAAGSPRWGPWVPASGPGGTLLRRRAVGSSAWGVWVFERRRAAGRPRREVPWRRRVAGQPPAGSSGAGVGSSGGAGEQGGGGHVGPWGGAGLRSPAAGGEPGPEPQPQPGEGLGGAVPGVLGAFAAVWVPGCAF